MYICFHSITGMQQKQSQITTDERSEKLIAATSVANHQTTLDDDILVPSLNLVIYFFIICILLEQQIDHTDLNYLFQRDRSDVTFLEDWAISPFKDGIVVEGYRRYTDVVWCNLFECAY